MVWKNQMLLASSGNRIEENWDNLDAWDINQYSPSGAYPAGGTATANSNRYTASGYPSSGGPIASIEGLSIADFTLSGSIEMVGDGSGDRTFPVVWLIDTQDEANERFYIFLADTGSTDATLNLTQTVGGTNTTFINQTSSISQTYNIDFVLERAGTTLNVDITGDFTVSNSYTVDDYVYDAIAVQVGRVSGISVNPQYIGPLTLEY